MTRICTRIIAICATLSVFPLFAHAADPIGKVVAVVSQPSASGPAGDRKLSGGDPVFEDDKIIVRNGNAQILLNDGTKLVVGPGSTLVLDQFLMSGGNTAQKVSIKALRGTFRFITGRSKKSAYDISTANATIGIRGTGFDYWVRKQTGVLVMEGRVQLTNDAGESVSVRADCELGRARSNDAQLLTGRAKSLAIQNNLPFVLNQRSLQRAFWLPIDNCRPYISRTGREGGFDPFNSPPPPVRESRPNRDQVPNPNGNTNPDTVP